MYVCDLVYPCPYVLGSMFEILSVRVRSLDHASRSFSTYRRTDDTVFRMPVDGVPMPFTVCIDCTTTRIMYYYIILYYSYVQLSYTRRK